MPRKLSGSLVVLLHIWANCRKPTRKLRPTHGRDQEKAMQTVVISDIHIGTNYKTCWYQQSVHEPYMLALLDYILQNANQGANPVNRFVILGDLFDFWTYPPSMEPPTIDEILAAHPNL